MKNLKRLNDPERPDIKFIPWKRKDGRWAIELIDQDQNSRGFIHWIESSDGTMCKVNDGNFSYSWHCEDEVRKAAKILREMWENGELQ